MSVLQRGMLNWFVICRPIRNASLLQVIGGYTCNITGSLNCNPFFTERQKFKDTLRPWIPIR